MWFLLVCDLVPSCGVLVHVRFAHPKTIYSSVYTHATYMYTNMYKSKRTCKCILRMAYICNNIYACISLLSCLCVCVCVCVCLIFNMHSAPAVAGELQRPRRSRPRAIAASAAASQAGPAAEVDHKRALRPEALEHMPQDECRGYAAVAPPLAEDDHDDCASLNGSAGVLEEPTSPPPEPTETSVVDQTLLNPPVRAWVTLERTRMRVEEDARVQAHVARPLLDPHLAAGDQLDLSATQCARWLWLLWSGSWSW